MTQEVDLNIPIVTLTVGQLIEVLKVKLPNMAVEIVKEEKKYVYGIGGIARLFNCSNPTASRIKASGKIDGAIRQIGRKIIIDTELALELIRGSVNE